jgi:uncharacterized protein (TIGR00661 family)
LSDTLKTNNLNNAKTKVIVAPLDWGLGHATRCIPIIRQLLKADYEVIIAVERAQMDLLKNEFPSLRFVNLPGYRLKYGKKSVNTTLKIFLQIPKILIQINREKRWLNIFLKKESIDAVISDNRYGFHSKKIISIFITHQLCIKTVFGKMIEKKLQQINYKCINKFSFCWVPDFEKNNSLAGELSHPKIFPNIPIGYIGPLSRFEKKENPINYKLLILLSGPEPQRTILENIFLNELKSSHDKTILVRGLPGEKKSMGVPSNVEVYNHLSASELNKKICQSELVICRSGYSTVMDLARLGKKSIMIPTLGQTEQEYLADYLFEKKIAVKINQKEFSLRKAIEIAENFSFEKYEEENNQLLDEAINKLTEKIYSSKK